MLLVDALDVRNDKVIVLVGGGGKTTAMYLLGRELAGLGGKVVVTTTTRINLPGADQAGSTVIARDVDMLRAGIQDALLEHRIAGAGYAVVDEGKLKGIPPEWVAEIADMVDYVVVEADGSAGRPFKAPAEHEPVIPACAGVVVAVVGVETVGLALSRENVHRPERVQTITGLSPGDVIGTRDVAEVLLHPSGTTKGTPPGVRVVALINKVENVRQLNTAREIGRLLLDGGIKRVVIGQVMNSSPVVEVMA